MRNLEKVQPVVVEVDRLSLCFNDVEYLTRLVGDEIDRGHTRIVLDLSSVHQIDSRAIGAMLKLLMRVTPHRGDIKLAGLQYHVRQVVTSLHLELIFEVFESIGEACQAFERVSYVSGAADVAEG